MKLTHTAILLALLLPTPLLASGSSFSRVDENADGAITPHEAKANLKGLANVHFNKCDSNRNGLISKSEFGCLSMLYDRLYRDR